MVSKRIFVLDGHPAQASLSHTFAKAYQEKAQKSGHHVRLRRLADMTFDPNHDMGGYASTKPLEPILKDVLSDIEWCDHFVLCSPMWWGSLPAKLKGLIDRAFIPGRTFSTRETTLIGLPKPLLTGRSALVILTADTPSFFLRLAYGNAVKRQIKGQILGFVGFKPVNILYFAPASDPTNHQVDKWITKVRARAKVGN